MATYYVDNALHQETNAAGTAAGGGANFILLADAGVQVDDAFNGYGVTILSGTGAGQQRRVTDYVHQGHPSGNRYAEVHAAWATMPDASSVYEITAGCDENSGAGLMPGAAGPWRSIDRGMNAIAGAGTGPHQLYVRGARTYAETATIDAVGTVGHGVIVEGFGAVPGDGLQVTISGGGVRASGIAAAVSGAVYHVIRNVVVTGCTGSGFSLANTSMVRLVNCRAESNGGEGLALLYDAVLLGCASNANGGAGYSCFPPSSGSMACLLLGCSAEGNAGHQVQGGSVVMVFCRLSGLPANRFGVQLPVFTHAAYLIGCTIDGAGQAGTAGLSMGSGCRQVVVNTILSGLDAGLQASEDDPCRLTRNNLYFQCGSPRVQFPSDGGDLEVDPRFVAPEAGNFGLRITSPAIRAGYPAGRCLGAVTGARPTGVAGPTQRGAQL